MNNNSLLEYPFFAIFHIPVLIFHSLQEVGRQWVELEEEGLIYLWVYLLVIANHHLE